MCTELVPDYELVGSYFLTQFGATVPSVVSVASKETIHMSYFAYACKMRCPLNLVLENSEYLWFYSTFCIVILDYGLKLHKLSNHTLVILQKWLEIHLIIVWSSHCVLFSAIFATEKFQKKMSTLSLKLNYWSPRHQTAVFKVLISFKCS